MLGEYTKEDFWKLYKKLPQEIKDALFAEETGNNIFEICRRNKIAKNLDEIVNYTGQVLLGVLPPEEFQEILEKKLKIGKEEAKKINREIFRFIFYPIKTSLEELYKIEIKPLADSLATSPEDKPLKKILSEGPATEEKKSEEETDIYRESY